ncbi:unnamed protein product [Lactuca saligna]|uniref:Uncharacterized protein n=1 Tax=Lactuca saligna TaxID=75948 RepID=A0AA36EPX5_LACSI|nr:unnamed protein product [Lactuca saligna]
MFFVCGFHVYLQKNLETHEVETNHDCFCCSYMTDLKMHIKCFDEIPQKTGKMSSNPFSITHASYSRSFITNAGKTKSVFWYFHFSRRRVPGVRKVAILIIQKWIHIRFYEQISIRSLLSDGELLKRCMWHATVERLLLTSTICGDLSRSIPAKTLIRVVAAGNMEERKEFFRNLYNFIFKAKSRTEEA